MELKIEAVALPVAAKKAGSKTSKYQSLEIITTADQLQIGEQSFHLPTIAGTTPTKMNSNVAYYLNKESKAKATAEVPAKTFISRIEKDAEGQETGIRIWRKA